MRSPRLYNLNTLFENALHGISRTYLYELVDLNSSSTNTSSNDHFGEFHDDWTPKAGATAIHNLTNILQGAGGGTASGPLYSVSGLPGTGHTFFSAAEQRSISLSGSTPRFTTRRMPRTSQRRLIPQPSVWAATMRL